MNIKFTVILAISILALSNVVSATENSSVEPLSMNNLQIERVSSSEFEDASLVESRVSNKTSRTGRNPQTGKEIQIATGNSGGLIDSMVNKLGDKELDGLSKRGTITIDGEVYHTNIKFNIIELPDIISSSEYRCGVSKEDNIVCQVTPFDDDERSRSLDPEVYCWGNNELSRCPNAEISSRSSRGRMKVSDVTLERAFGSDDGHKDDIEILSWSWGSSTTKSSENTDPDYDTIEMRYVWRFSGKPVSSGSGNDRPSETLSFSFDKIEIKYSTDNGEGSGGTILIDVPEMRVYQNSLVFTEISFPDLARSDDGRVCGITDHFLLGEDCDDDDPAVTPYSKADAKKALDGFTRAIDNIKSSLERCGEDICRQVRANADIRKRLVESAIVDIGNMPSVVLEIKGIVEEDIAALEHCRTDVCRDVLSQEKELLNTIENLIVMLRMSGDTIWPHDWSKNISDFSYYSKNGNDESSESDTFTDKYLDVDDGIITQAEGNGRGMRASAALIRNVTGGVSPRDISEDEKRDVREYLAGLEELKGKDLGLSIVLEVSGNEHVRKVRFNEETNEVEVEHEEEIRLLGFIPVQVRVRTRIDSDMNEKTEYPWWSFFATKENKIRFKAGSDVSKSVN